MFDGLYRPREEDRPTMDGSKGHPKLTAGLDLGDRYSYLCLIDQENGEVMEEGRLRTSPEAFLRRFASERPMRIAIEAGTHSPWASRVLEECGHEVLVEPASGAFGRGQIIWRLPSGSYLAASEKRADGAAVGY